MKLEEFLENLNELVKNRPECLEFDVVTSKDDEGNGFNLVTYSPCIGHLDEDQDFSHERVANAICIN